MRTKRQAAILAAWKAGRISLHVAEDLLDKEENEQRLRLRRNL